MNHELENETKMMMKKALDIIRTKQTEKRSETRSPERDAIFSREKQTRGKGRGRVWSAGGAEEEEKKRVLIFAERGGLIILKT